ncbi:hypothetical protein UT300005_10330 [Clostridium sp. CTA-5]
MLRHNKFILGMLSLAISTSIISYKTTIKTNAESIQLGAYDSEEDKDLPTRETTDENGITWNYKLLNDGTLYLQYAKNVQANMEVPEKLDGRIVSVIGDIVQYEPYRDYIPRGDTIIKSVKIPSTVRFIGPHSFNCRNLINVELPNTTWVSEYAFTDAPWLENQRNSKGLIIINGRLLSAKNQSGDIKIPSNVKEIANGAFTGGHNITSVTIPNSVTEIGNNAFIDCRNMESIKLPDNIKEIKSCTFAYCHELKNIKIPDSVTKIGDNAFSECNKLENIIIPDSVVEIDNDAFFECTSLKKLKIYNDNIHLRRGSFSNCDQLNNVELPSNASIEEGAFDEGVTIIKNGTSYVNKAPKNTSSNTGNSVPQTSIVQQGWHKDGDYWYWLWSDGTKRNGWYEENGNWFYFYGNGQMATGFINLNGAIYYLNPNSDGYQGAMKTGWNKINGYWYYFNPLSDGYKGLMARGWLQEGGNWYYFYYDGTMAANTTINGYYVNSSGAWVR